jgi:hypothetical protein
VIDGTPPKQVTATDAAGCNPQKFKKKKFKLSSNIPKFKKRKIQKELQIQFML